jgi:hypothetical protein
VIPRKRTRSVATAAGRAYGSAVPRTPLLVLLLALPSAASAQDDSEPYGQPPEHSEHLRVTGWGGTLVGLGGSSVPAASSSSSALLGGEITYALLGLDVGVLVQEYHLDRSRSPREWTPVVLARIEQRFETRRDVDAVIAIGLGAAHTGAGSSWQGWYQFALGVRVGLGPLFLAGEVGFEQLDLFRLAAGLGFRL